MSGVSALWQRRPVLFALGLATLTVAGLVVMLGDAAAWKPAGFVLAALPPVMMFFLMQRHFIAGLTLGATKG